ncbi:hypothetical protein NEOLEDRAFT_1054001 [Neolentinus lepideus HHB14362 ss-1]|uniref:F-box domain-containing protein n=1 Tax=Neolentinus lepideus HHB14362 ss-1 TaxID=1314782 RepID=A0A165W6Z8_9AGAM|nr:hypothetical protein NEOLEDRAFT_1054001 [Neolentinus lepideus HHB14362 ss-1]
MQDHLLEAKQSDSVLDHLPLELIIDILHYLDLATLLRCSSVSLFFYGLVKETANLQYNIELEANGLVDGPRNDLSSAEKLDMLRQRQTAWERMEWVEQRTISMANGNLYELYGGVFAQSLAERSLVFKRLPSRYRQIEERTWTIGDVGVDMRDFSIDPGQNLLAIIEELWIRNERSIRVHLRTLSTGEPHPSTSQPAIVSHSVDEFPPSYQIQICGDYIGVCSMGSVTGVSRLAIWNWKMRQLQMTLEGLIFSFAFLSHRHIVVSLDARPMQSLCVYNYVDNDIVDLNVDDDVHLCKFLFPPFRTPLAAVNIVIRCDPAPGWTPPADVPFYVAPDNRVYVVTLVYNVQFGQIGVYSLFIPASTFLSRLPLPPDCGHQRDYSWPAWGPSGCRMLTNLRQSLSWVCWVYGSKFMSWDLGIHASDETLVKPKIFDFNPLTLRRFITEKRDDIHFMEHTDGDPLGLFTEPMFTSFPYRVKMGSLDLPEWEPSDINSIMLSEDSILVVAVSEIGLP